MDGDSGQRNGFKPERRSRSPGLKLQFGDESSQSRGSLVLNFGEPSKVKAKVPSPHDHCSHNVFHMLESHAMGNLCIKGERIRSTIDEREQKQLLKEIDVVMNSSDCPYIVEFYGAIFKEGDCWICMELMATSLDRLYKAVHTILEDVIPEKIVGRVALCVTKALDYLKTTLKIIHRDVKPSNMLIDFEGNIKLCDFGISGQLVDSIAKTRDAGCRPYMAPERIDPMAAKHGYDIRSDVWSLGISLIEIATGKFPYPKWNSIFEQLSQVVNGTPPQLINQDSIIFSEDCLHFVNSCVTKDVDDRPKYKELLQHKFLKENEKMEVDVAGWFKTVREGSKGRIIFDNEQCNEQFS